MDSLSSVPSALLADDTAVGHAVVIDRRVVNIQIVVSAAKGKRKTNWNCGVLIGQRNIFTKLQNLLILLLSNHGTAEKNSGMFQNVDNRSETGENSSRASMFQCPGGPGLLPAFKILKIEPRIPSKWLIVIETENCWRLFNMFKSDVKSGQKWQRTGAANIRGGSGWQPQGRLHRRLESAHWSGENFQFLCCGKDNLSNLNPSYIVHTT